MELGTPYDFSFTVTGDPAPTCSVSGGQLPPGLDLSADCRLTGTVNTIGSWNFEVEAYNPAWAPQYAAYWGGACASPGRSRRPARWANR